MPPKMKKKKEKVKEEPATYNTLDIDYLRRQFDEFDKDGSGYLEEEECKAALAKIGSCLRFADLDTDKDNKISFEEFTIFTQLVGKHTHPIFKHANKNTSTNSFSKTGISIFAGEAHLNEAFMKTAGNAWRKLGEAARKKGFTADSIEKAFKAIDRDGDGELDPGEIRLAIKEFAPQLTEIDITIMLACADKDEDNAITCEEFKAMLLHDHQEDVKYWEKYGARDMHTGIVKDRKHQIRY